MSTFIENMREIATNEEYRKQIKHEKFIEQQNKYKDELFKYLSNKYYFIIVNSIVQASCSGKTYKYINFGREDFIVEFSGLQNSIKNQEQWLNDMISESSLYKIGNLPSLYGLQYSILKNKKFTTVFTWGYNPELDRDGTQN